MADLHRLDIAGLHGAYAAGETTPSAVVAQYLARIDRYNPALNAYVGIDREGALAAAALSDQRVAAGDMRALEGVPIAVKSNIAVKGLEWNAGMEARRGIIAETDAQAVARLRDAGAIILGTLNMHEAALGATTDNPWFGRTINPHRDGYTPGGSSGGSGAAVAASLCLASLGTDTLGSVRIPSAYNGVYGIKPTHGAISDGGLAPMSEWLDSIGPLARSLDDVDAVLAVIADGMDGGPAAFARLLTLNAMDDLECQPSVMVAYARALEALGAMPRELFTPSDNAASVRFAGFVISARELGGHIATIRSDTPDKISPELHFMLDRADGKSDADTASAADILHRTGEALRAALGSDGVLLMPTAPQAAFPHTARPPANQAGFTAFANIAGLPALSIPAGFDEDRLPVAVQLVGPAGSERALLDLARILDAGLCGYAPPEMN
ncbi:MAG: amidase [Sphingomonadales bacterium]|nr:MAG: amidase [Sphingomonadales bacterium]